MKVLLIGPRPPPHGGISVHVAGIHGQMVRAGIRCEVLDIGKGRLGSAFACSLVWRALRGWPLQVHTNGHNNKSWLLALICGVAGLLPGGSVLTLHSGMVPEYLERSQWRGRMAKIACFLFPRVVCVSAAIRVALVGAGVPPDKIAISPAYLPIQASAVSLYASLGAWMDRHDPRCSTTLFFRPEYCFGLLIPALEKLLSRHPALGCVVMGSGDGRAEAELSVRNAGLEDAVLMVGDVDHETCLAVMARSDVFLRPALVDGDSTSVREALALGVPVIASHVGTRPPGTILFRSGDKTDLLEKIESVLAPKRMESGHAKA
jgi:glycogen(starch) synthase